MITVFAGFGAPRRNCIYFALRIFNASHPATAAK